MKNVHSQRKTSQTAALIICLANSAGHNAHSQIVSFPHTDVMGLHTAHVACQALWMSLLSNVYIFFLEQYSVWKFWWLPIKLQKLPAGWNVYLTSIQEFNCFGVQADDVGAFFQAVEIAYWPGEFFDFLAVEEQSSRKRWKGLKVALTSCTKLARNLLVL